MQNKLHYTSPVLTEVFITGMTSILVTSLGESSIQNFTLYDNEEE